MAAIKGEARWDGRLSVLVFLFGQTFGVPFCTDVWLN
jgi:hypothetical protein